MELSLEEEENRLVGIYRNPLDVGTPPPDPLLNNRELLPFCFLSVFQPQLLNASGRVQIRNLAAFPQKPHLQDPLISSLL